MISGLLPFPWSVWTVKSHNILHLSFSITTSGSCSYQFSFTSTSYLLHISQWILVPNQSCRFLFYFCVNLLHSLNTWFTLSSAFPHVVRLLLPWVLSAFVFLLLPFIAYSCAAMIKTSVVVLSTLFLAIHINLHLFYPLFAW